MKNHIGRVSRNESEEIRISLQEAHEELHAELRVYSRSARQGGAYLPEPESIVVPVRVLSHLCRILQQTHDRFLKKGVEHIPSLTHITNREAGDPVTLQLADLVTLEAIDAPAAPSASDTPPEERGAARRPVECHLLAAPDTWPSKPLPRHVTGEVTNVSSGGAQLWLPDEFPVSTHLAVFTKIGAMNFRGKAEVVAALPQAMGGFYRHTIQWLSLNPQATAALSKFISATR